MQRIYRSMQSHHSANQLYKMVNDTNAYSRFIPYCQKSQILGDEDANPKRCLLSFSYAGLSCELITLNTLTPSSQIQVSLESGPFSALDGRWQFEDNQGGCLVIFDFEYCFSHPILDKVFSQVFYNLSSQMVSIFCQRANDECIY